MPVKIIFFHSLSNEIWAKFISLNSQEVIRLCKNCIHMYVCSSRILSEPGHYRKWMSENNNRTWQMSVIFTSHFIMFVFDRRSSVHFSPTCFLLHSLLLLFPSAFIVIISIYTFQVIFIFLSAHCISLEWWAGDEPSLLCYLCVRVCALWACAVRMHCRWMFCVQCVSMPLFVSEWVELVVMPWSSHTTYMSSTRRNNQCQQHTEMDEHGGSEWEKSERVDENRATLILLLWNQQIKHHNHNKIEYVFCCVETSTNTCRRIRPCHLFSSAVVIDTQQTWHTMQPIHTCNWCARCTAYMCLHCGPFSWILWQSLSSIVCGVGRACTIACVYIRYACECHHRIFFLSHSVERPPSIVACTTGPVLWSAYHQTLQKYSKKKPHQRTNNDQYYYYYDCEWCCANFWPTTWLLHNILCSNKLIYLLFRMPACGLDGATKLYLSPATMAHTCIRQTQCEHASQQHSATQMFTNVTHLHPTHTQIYQPKKLFEQKIQVERRVHENPWCRCDPWITVGWCEKYNAQLSGPHPLSLSLALCVSLSLFVQIFCSPTQSRLKWKELFWWRGNNSTKIP